MRSHYTHPAMEKAFSALEHISAEETLRIQAEERERALRDEISLFHDAREEGRKEGRKEGREEGRKEGTKEGKMDMAQKLLRMDILSIEQIAETSGLSPEEIRKLADS